MKIPSLKDANTDLLLSEANALAKVDQNIPLIDTIVFLVHPLVEDICVQNPASMDLMQDTRHQVNLLGRKTKFTGKSLQFFLTYNTENLPT